MKDQHPNKPLFLLGHSMGGMVALRAVLRHPAFFSGMILNGPLIVPGPQVGPIDFRSTPFRTFISKTVLQFLSWFIPNVSLGRPNLNVITRYKNMNPLETYIYYSLTLLGTKRLNRCWYRILFDGQEDAKSCFC